MNKKWLQTTVDYLYGVIGEEIERYGGLFLPGNEFYFSKQDKRIAIQNMAKELIMKLNFCKELGTILVTFEKDISAPGMVELSDDRDFYISLNSDIANNSKEVGAVLSHEIMHIYMKKKNIVLGNNETNEKMVDLSTILFGYGILVLNGMTERNKGRTMQRKYYGYLSPLDFGYLFARYMILNKLDNNIISENIDDVGREIMERGMRDYNADKENNKQIQKKYLKVKNKVDKIVNNYNVSEGNRHNEMRFSLEICGNVIMTCNKCFKEFKVPYGKGKIKIKCPRCEFELLCIV